MVKTNHLGALGATAGTLVAVGLLMLMALVVEARLAEATFPGKLNASGGGGSFNVTDNTTNDYTPSYSPGGEKIAYRGSGSGGRHNDIYTINVGGGVSFDVTDDAMNERDPSYSPDGTKISFFFFDCEYKEIYTINAGTGS